MTDRLKHHRQEFLNNWFSFSPHWLFALIALTYAILFYIKRIFIIDEIAAFEVLNERGDMWMFDVFYSIQYMSIPIFLMWKWTWTTLLLWIGCFMYGYRIYFAQLWKLVMLAEILFFIPEILKVIWLPIFYTDPNYFDYQAFYPLSVLHFFDHTYLDQRWIYPLKSLNLFEPIYWILLVIGIYFISSKKLKTSFLIVFSSYVLFFFLWIGFYLLVY